MLKNTQPAECPTDTQRLKLDIVDVWSTLQGEGPFVGTPSVFVRLAGCNLQCANCDTNYTEGRNLRTLLEIMKGVNAVRGLSTLVVLSGGEPFRQNIAPLCHLLLKNNSTMRLQVETNGTLFCLGVPYSNPRLTVVCSPKASRVSPQLVEHIDYWKYVVDSVSGVEGDGLPKHTMGNGNAVARPPSDVPSDKIFIQPLDPLDDPSGELAEANKLFAMKLCLSHGFRLSLQTHKLGI